MNNATNDFCFEDEVSTLEFVRSDVNTKVYGSQSKANVEQIQGWVYCLYDLMRDFDRQWDVVAKTANKSNAALISLLQSNEDVGVKRLRRCRLKLDDLHEMWNHEQLIDAQVLVGNDQAKEFWTREFARNRYAVPWEEFRGKFKIVLGDLNEPAWPQLKAKLTLNDDNNVTMVRLDTFLEYSGAAAMKEAMASLVSSEEAFFGGFLTHENASFILEKCEPGAFLVRFTAQLNCGLVLMCKSPKTKSIVQYMITLTKDGFKLDNVSYESLSLAVRSKVEDCQFPVPLLKSQADLRYFTFFSKSETKQWLDGQPEGSFLCRFSTSSLGQIVIGYVMKTEDGLKLKSFQTRVEPSREGYVLQTDAGNPNGGHVYKSIEELVEAQKEVLKIPYSRGAAFAPIFTASSVTVMMSSQFLPGKEDSNNYGTIEPLM